MNDNVILAFTIILSFIGIIISMVSLIFAIIYLLKVSKLEKVTKNINIIKEVLISQLILFDEKGNTINGQKVLEIYKKEFNCDDYTALMIYYAKKD